MDALDLSRKPPLYFHLTSPSISPRVPVPASPSPFTFNSTKFIIPLYFQGYSSHTPLSFLSPRLLTFSLLFLCLFSPCLPRICFAFVILSSSFLRCLFSPLLAFPFCLLIYSFIYLLPLFASSCTLLLSLSLFSLSTFPRISNFFPFLSQFLILLSLSPLPSRPVLPSLLFFSLRTTFISFFFTISLLLLEHITHH